MKYVHDNYMTRLWNAILTSGFSTPSHCWQFGMWKSSFQYFSSISISPSGLCCMPKLLSEPGFPQSKLSTASAHCSEPKTFFKYPFKCVKCQIKMQQMMVSLVLVLSSKGTKKMINLENGTTPNISEFHKSVKITDLKERKARWFGYLCEARSPRDLGTQAWVEYFQLWKSEGVLQANLPKEL